MTDRKQPPEGYRVYEMGAKSVGHTGELRDHFTSGAVLISDGEHWTWDDAVAACEAHRDRIAAGAVAAVVEIFRERQRQAEACMGREQITHREAANMIERTKLPEPAAALARLLAAERVAGEKALDHMLDHYENEVVPAAMAEARRKALEEGARLIERPRVRTWLPSEAAQRLRELARQGGEP